LNRRTVWAVAVLPLLAALTAATAPAASALPDLTGKTVEYNVLTADGASVTSIQAAVKAAGGTVVSSNTAVGLITATAPESGFVERVAVAPAVSEVARSRVIGQAPKAKPVPKPDTLVANESGGNAGVAGIAKPGMDPLDSQQWGLQNVRSDLARTKQAGDKRVKVGIIDTGIDGNHPDIAPNFDRALSRNFVKDIPFDENGQVLDGPCEFQGCVDPVDWDDEGNGTHVAGIIAAAANGSGISGVAPNVTLVNLRATLDSGYVFVQPVVNALTYAGDVGIDLVDMGFYVDPWLYNCSNNPADSPQQQAQQRIVNIAMTRALNYAYHKGVTQVVSLGNHNSNLDAPQDDVSSPDYPSNASHPRQIDNATCFSQPAEGPHTIGVNAYGPSGKKGDYAMTSLEHISVSAPGGFLRDFFGTPQFSTYQNKILSTMPRNVGVTKGFLDADGNITPAGVTAGVEQAKNAAGVTGYYQWLQGNAQATPHAVGVAALIISQYGHFNGNSVAMNPDAVKRVLEGTAFKTPCPTPRTVDYLKEGRDASYTATCMGDQQFNNFYGHGQVDAYAAVTRGADFL
jgi:subtilisin family serine protease